MPRTKTIISPGQPTQHIPLTAEEEAARDAEELQPKPKFLAEELAKVFSGASGLTKREKAAFYPIKAAVHNALAEDRDPEMARIIVDEQAVPSSGPLFDAKQALLRIFDDFGITAT